jgi:hypothetical protein
MVELFKSKGNRLSELSVFRETAFRNFHNGRFLQAQNRETVSTIRSPDALTFGALRRRLFSTGRRICQQSDDLVLPLSQDAQQSEATVALDEPRPIEAQPLAMKKGLWTTKRRLTTKTSLPNEGWPRMRKPFAVSFFRVLEE